MMHFLRSDASGPLVCFGMLVQPSQCLGSRAGCMVMVEGRFLLLCTVSSVTGQREAFSRGLVALSSGVHCGLSAGSVPLVIPTD